MATRRPEAARRGGSAAPARSSAGFDRVLHERSRLAILVALLARPEGVVFPELKRLCGFTDGNLNRHLAVLQEAGVVEQWKGAGPGRPRTLVRLSAAGRTQFLAYLAELERVVLDAKAAAMDAAAERPRVGGGPSLSPA